MTKHSAIATVVHAVRAAGLPIHEEATLRRPSVPGVAVRLGWRRGTVDVLVHGVDLAPVREVISAAGWREVYVNERGGCVSVAL